MITPVFRLDQDDKFVYIIMIIKYAKMSNADFDIDGCNFRFYVKPYSLNLTFSGELKEMGEGNKSSYDLDKQQLTVQVEKANHGEHFENLDMVTSLLSKFPKPMPKLDEETKQEIQKHASDHNRPLIEVISSTPNEDEDEELDMEEEKVTMDDMEEKLIRSYHYGFNNLYNDVFKYRKEELYEFADIDPENIWQEDRMAKKLEIEKEKFDDERYVMDLFGETQYEINEIIEEEHPFTKYLASSEIDDITKRLENLKIDSEDNILTTDEIQECLKVRNREYIIDRSSPNIPLQCIDILWAYLYDYRVYRFGETCETTWGIAKISSTISCFVDFKNCSVKDVLISLYRRSLTYPLYRNFALNNKITEDLCTILKIGRKAILKCFIRMKTLNERRDCGYLINRAFINDFIVWVQQAGDSVFQQILEELYQVSITKEDLDLGLKEIEEFAQD